MNKIDKSTCNHWWGKRYINLIQFHWVCEICGADEEEVVKNKLLRLEGKESNG